ncbi:MULTISPECIES: sel1 repeat family protein [unclassified Sphingopyxis]|uniref:sel1 repeat family protein n=1 Tax=unclassified Sphingopyxis TaxID=2614943 RepID=UPI0007370634|nr:MULTISPECIES: sel1 repeat family protein [unclassified Sphingopyxis]KTE36532.1 hypothetical protein ATE62_14335 [Sphingopyxis sp. HIX]KTE84512.1 hypothetical protein ATE72_08635 [Sphingopyxis sp. HXXIV]
MAGGVVEIRFPVVILGEAILTAVRAEPMPTLDGQERFAVGHQHPDALDMLADARAGEPDARRLDGVMIRFLRRDFSGRSFGLALALADKGARHAPPAAPVIATGSIAPGGRGTIEPIDAFEAKVRHILRALEQAPPATPPVFAFAKRNLDAADEATRAALTAAAQAGRIVLRPAERIDDLADLWTAAADRAPQKWSARRMALAAAGALLLVVAAGYGWSMLRAAPLRDCEAALRALDAPGAADEPAGIAAAVERCGAAARARPDSGRILFLTGQAHALNGGARLASAYWRRAALAGDPDGLAAHGRDLWLSGPGDPASMKIALGFLERAGEKGSVAAVEDMAQIHREGIGVAADPRRADDLLRRAADMRGDEE